MLHIYRIHIEAFDYIVLISSQELSPNFGGHFGATSMHVFT